MIVDRQESVVRISWRGVHTSFGSNHVQRGISLDVQQGHVHFIVGRSGAGKSVLIKQAVGLLRPDRGAVFLNDDDVTSLSEDALLNIRQRCQYIFQHATLFDALSVLENVAMPYRHRFAHTKAQSHAAARQALASVDVIEPAILAALPYELGVGMQKRVAIARALALKPQVLLYDEPTTGLDPIAARRMDALIRKTSVRPTWGGVTSVVVSHDLTSVAAIADRVTLLLNGLVRFDGSATKFFSSSDPEVQAFASAAH